MELFLLLLPAAAGPAAEMDVARGRAQAGHWLGAWPDAAARQALPSGAATGSNAETPPLQ